MTLGKQLVRWLLEYKWAFFAKCPPSWACKGYFDKVVKTAPAKVCSTERTCPTGASEKGRCSSALWSCFLWVVFSVEPGTLYCQPIHMAVSCVVTFFPSGGMLLVLLKARVRKCLCLSSVPSNSAGVFVISCCRDWGLCWKEHWLCPFTTFVALISKWHCCSWHHLERWKACFSSFPRGGYRDFGRDSQGFLTTCQSTGFWGKGWSCSSMDLSWSSIGFCLFNLPCGVVACAGCSANLLAIIPKTLTCSYVFGLRHYSAEELTVARIVRHWWRLFCSIFKIFHCCLRGLSSVWALQVSWVCSYTRQEIKRWIAGWLSCLRGHKEPFSLVACKLVIVVLGKQNEALLVVLWMQLLEVEGSKRKLWEHCPQTLRAFPQNVTFPGASFKMSVPLVLKA